MGYEILLCIPMFLFFFCVLIHYTKSIRAKYTLLVFTVLFTVVFTFIVPGPLGLKKTPPFVYWAGGYKGKVYWTLHGFITRFLRSIGFEW